MKLIKYLGILCAIFWCNKSRKFLELEMDTHCLAQNIYFEIFYNQPLAGKIAVVKRSSKS